MTIKNHSPKRDLCHRCTYKDQYCYRNRWGGGGKEGRWKRKHTEKRKMTEDSPNDKKQRREVGRARQSKVVLIVTRFTVPLGNCECYLCLAILSLGLVGPVTDEKIG